MFDNRPRARERLESEQVIWMTTVNAAGHPQTSPVWFLVDSSEFVVYSAETSRIANLATNPAVALNLDGNGRGGDIVTIEGTARLAPDEQAASANEAYVAKYEEAMRRNGWSPEQFAELYPIAIRITFDGGRAW